MSSRNIVVDQAAPEPRFVLRLGADVIDLRVGPTTLGRSAECEIVVDDDGVSRQHAAIEVGNSGVTIEDLGSRNGTRVDGVRIRARTALHPGSVIEIGETQLVLLDRDREERPTTEAKKISSVDIRVDGLPIDRDR